MVDRSREHAMADTSSISSSSSALIARRPANLSQIPGASSSLFGNLLRRSEVAMGLRSQTGFSSGATYEAQTIAGQTKATVSNAVSATKSFFHIK
jgi:hypothetical protein